MTTTAPKAVLERRDRALYRIEVSVLYHRKRERFLEFWDRVAKAIALAAGAAAVASFADEPVARAIGGVVAAASAITLVFGFPERARRHSDLARRFLELESRIVEAGDAMLTEGQIGKWEADIRMIESEEPAGNSALIRVCQAEVAISRGLSPERIAWWERAFAQVLDLPKIKQRDGG